jgi:C1A family cysteine protease
MVKTHTRQRKTHTPKRPAGTPSTVDVSRRICNLVPSIGTDTDWSFRDSLAAGRRAPLAAPPPSVDLRAPWWTVNDQEDTGSCVGWATADGLVRYHMVKAGRLAKTQLLSPRFVWMASKETDEYTTRADTFIEEAGTSLKAAIDVIRKYGAVTETLLPFHISTKMHTGNENAFYAAAAQRKIASYFNLQRNLAQWKSWLASNGPILVGLAVDQTWENASATGGNIDVFMPGTVRGGHAVTIVGYLASGRFIVRNSWGTGWGDQGFGYVTPAYIAAGFFDEAYGVTA